MTLLSRCWCVQRLLAATAISVLGCAGPRTSLAPTTPGEALQDENTVKCSAIRPPTEPDLMAWDPGSRATISMLRERGAVAVRYRAKGCDVQLEVIPTCVGDGDYDYVPYAATETKTVRNAQDLYAELPLGAARVVGKLGRERALRTDYALVGVAALPPQSPYDASGLRGPGCERATHVVSKIYLGGFSLVAGEARALQGSSSFFSLGAGAKHADEVERITSEGDLERCRRAFRSGKPDPLCAVPLRLSLIPIEHTGRYACPDGAEWDGDQCVERIRKTRIDCLAPAFFNGVRCVMAPITKCQPGWLPKNGRLCVPAKYVHYNKVPVPVPRYPYPVVPKADKPASERIEFAVDEHYLARKYDAAEAVLHAVVHDCRSKCSRTVQARAWMYIGIIHGTGRGDEKRAKLAFYRSIGQDRELPLDVELADDPTATWFAEARRTSAETRSRELRRARDRDQATLILISTPEASVLLDKKPRGTAPIVVGTTPGTHVAEFIHPRFGQKVRKVSVRAAGTAKAEVEFP